MLTRWLEMNSLTITCTINGTGQIEELGYKF
jgi:hypothetical protein